MALIFSSDWANAFLWQGFYGQWRGRTYAWNTTSPVASVTVFSGTQPSAPSVVSSWSTYSANYLIHWNNIVAPAPTGYNTLGGLNLGTFVTPAAVNAFRSGTAEWAIIWPNVYSEATIQGASLPSNEFLIVPVSTAGGSGWVKLTSLSLTSGTSYQPLDISLRFGTV